MEIAQSDAAAYFDWYRIETWKGYDERPRRPRSPATRATTTSGALPASAACGRACATSTTRRPTATSCSWRRSRRSGRTSARASTAWTSSRSGRARSIADHARGNIELQAILRDIFRTRTITRVARRSPTSTTPRSRRSTRRRRCSTTRSSRTGSRGPTPEQTGAAELLFPLHVEGEELPVPTMAPDGRRAHRRGAAPGARLRRRPDRADSRHRRTRLNRWPDAPGRCAGIRVLDLSIALTGPYAAALLADQGADGDQGRAAGHRRHRPLGRRLGQRHELALPRVQPGQALDRGRPAAARGRRHRAAARGRRRRDHPELPARRDGQARARLRRRAGGQPRRRLRVAHRASAPRARTATAAPTTR